MNIHKAVDDNIGPELNDVRCEMENTANKLAELSLHCARLLALNYLNNAMNDITKTVSTSDK